VLKLTTLSLISTLASSTAVDGDSQPSLKASIAAVPLETLVVSATRTSRAAFTTPAATSTIEREDIQQQQPYSYQDILDSLPGVVVRGGPRRIAEEPVIRGFADERVTLRIDGTRMTFNKAHGGRFLLDPGLIRRIEVLRGAGSAIYGSGAIGGAMLIETVDGRDLTDGRDGLGLRLGAGYDSNGEQWSAQATAFAQQGVVDALASFSWRDVSEDLQGGSGQSILGSADRVGNGLIKAGYQIDQDQRLSMSLGRYENTGLNPTNANSVATARNLVDRDTERRHQQLRYQHQAFGPGSGDLSLSVYGQSVQAIESRLDDQRLDETDHETRGFEALHSVAVADEAMRLTLGLEHYRDEQTGRRNGADRQQFPDARVDYQAGFLQAEWTAGSFSLIPGLRYDAFDYTSDNRFAERNESELTPRLALGWQPSTKLYGWLEYTEAFRAPSLTELYADGVHFVVPLAPGQVVINEFMPTPDLRSEHAQQVSAGLRWRDDIGKASLSLEATAWRSQVEDYIDQFVVFIAGEPSFDPRSQTLIFPGITSNRNVDAELWGGELSARLSHSRGYLGLALTQLKGRRSDIEGTLASLSPHNATLSGGLHALGGDLTLGGEWHLSAARDDVPEQTLATPGYGVVDVFLSYRPSEGWLANTEWRLVVDNLFDRAHRLHGNAIEQPGRSLRLSVSTPITWMD
jgi:hemoglobin/transferrin/lactoferrin receptor protein